MLIQNQKNSLAFTSLPLCRVNLNRLSSGNKIGTKTVLISLLNETDKKDLEAIKKILGKWTTTKKATYIGQIETERFCEDFLGLSNSRQDDPGHARLYLAVESERIFPFGPKILGLMKVRKSSEKFNGISLSYLITNPEFSSDNKQRKLGGIGEILFSKAVQICRGGKFNELSWVSDNDPFYFNLLGKAGINAEEAQRGISFVLPKKLLPSLQEYLDGKYKTSFLSTPAEKELSSKMQNFFVA